MEPEQLNRFMVEVFNDILHIEERFLTQNRFKRLSVREFHVIEAVVNAKGQGTAKTIAEALRITQGSVSTALTTLEKKGMAQRVADKQDKRVVRLSPTEAALQAHSHHMRFHKALVDVLTEKLDAADFEGFAHGLSVLHDFFQADTANLQIRGNLMNTIILTDSTSDIEQNMAAEWGVTVLPLSVTFGDTSYADGVTLNKKEFYKLQADSEHLPTTSQVNPDAFLQVFERCKASGQEVIYISIAAELSGTMQSASIAKEMCGYDGIYLVDSRSATATECALVEVACRLRDEGKSAQEIVDYLRAKGKNGRLIAVLDTLKYLVRGGRISQAAGTIGSILNMKPIISVQDGEIVPVDKARGRAKAFQAVLQRVKALELDPTMPVYIMHSNNEDLAEEFAGRLQAEGLITSYRILEVGSVIGTHTGPNCVGIACFTHPPKDSL